jgi:hypothetical protein
MLLFFGIHEEGKGQKKEEKNTSTKIFIDTKNKI